MRNTPNYNLPQYDGTDKFTKEVLNDAFNKVDMAINDLQETFNSQTNANINAQIINEVSLARKGKDQLKDKIDEIDTNISNSKNTIDTLNENVNVLKERATNVENKAKELESNKFDKSGGELLGEVTNRNKYYMLGSVGGRGFITKNNATGRNELLIYADEKAYSVGSRGAGIQIYGNSDNEHPGNIAFVTGLDDSGDVRMMLDQRGRVVMGNGIVDYTDEQKNPAVLTIKNPQGTPAIYFTECSSTEGELAVEKGEVFRIGHFDSNSSTFTPRLEVTDSTIRYNSNDLVCKNTNIKTGRQSITPVANEVTTVQVTFDTPFSSSPIVNATLNSAVIGDTVKGIGVTEVTNEGFKLSIYRTNTTETFVYWSAIA